MADFKRFTPQFTIYKFITALAYAFALPTAFASFYVQVDSGRATINGVIAGAVRIEKIGAGSAILAAINAYTGGTLISAGELLINGSVPGDVEVGAGTKLGGTGTIGGSVSNNGAIRTGENPGEFLTIVTDYVQSSRASFLVKTSPAAFDCLKINGVARLAGSLNINVPQGDYPSSTYTILDAIGGITGSFVYSPTIGNANVALSYKPPQNPTQLLLTISGNTAANLTTYTQTDVTSTDITSAPGPLILRNCNVTGSTLASTTVPLTLKGNTVVTVAPGSMVDLNNTELLSSDTNSTTIFSGGGKVNLTGDGTGLQGILHINNITFGMNCPQSTPLAASEIIVERGASKLKGTGYYNTHVTNHGRLKPGNSVGTIHLGSYTGMDTSTLEIEFNPTNASKLDVIGATILDGTLQLIPETPSTVGPTETINFNTGSYTYQIVTTRDDVDGIQGTFAHVSVPNVNTLAYSLSYANDYDTLLVNLQVSAPTTFITSLAVDGSANFTSGSVSGNNLTGAGYKAILAPYIQPKLKALGRIIPDKLDAIGAADETLIAVAAGIGVSSATTKTFKENEDFRSLNLTSMGRVPPKDRLLAVLHALQENGPMSFGQNQHRVWLSPYTTMGRTDNTAGQAGNHRWTVGALVGYEYRNVAPKSLVGLILGGSTGLQTVTGTPESWTRSKGLTTGLYAGSNLTEEVRVEAIGLWIHNAMKKQRAGNDARKGTYHAISKIKQDTLVGDVSTSYLVKLNENWSVRPNIGNTFFSTSTGSSKEKNTPSPINTAASNSQVSQMYCGIGGRYQWESNKLVYRLTTVFEVGREYYKRGTPIKTTTFDSTGRLPPQSFSTNGDTKKVTTKYLTINGVILDEEEGLKHILCYSGQFLNGSRTHSFTLKVEKRF